MYLQPGGQYSEVKLQDGATDVGNGEIAYCTQISGGAHKYLTLQVTGINGDVITWEANIDGTTWAGILVKPLATGTDALTANANGLYRVDVTGLVQFRARVSTNGTGTIYVTGMLTAL